MIEENTKYSELEISAIEVATDAIMSKYKDLIASNKSSNNPKDPTRIQDDDSSRKAVKDVKYILSNPEYTAEDAHNRWLKNKQQLGMTERSRKTPHTRNPLIKEYDEIPKRYRVLDELYFCIVRQLGKVVHEVTGPAYENLTRNVETIRKGEVIRNSSDGGYPRDDMSNVSRPIFNR